MEVEVKGAVTETGGEAAESAVESESSFDMEGAVNDISDSLGFEAEVGEGAEETESAPPATEGEEAAPAEAAAPAPAVEKTPAPRTWRAEASAEWDKLPPTVQAEVLKREEDMFKGIESYKADATFGKSIAAAIQPYAHIIKQHNINPAQQISNLMGAHYRLAFGTQAEKMEMLNRIVTDYGIKGEGEAPYVDPAVQALQDELRSLKSSVQGVNAQREAEIRSSLTRDIEAFTKDPANEDFELVANDIAALLQSGQAGTLREAYDKAVWLNPAARAKQLARETTQAAAAAEKAAKEKAAAVRKATAANVTTRAKSASVTTPLGSMDDTLEAAFASIKARG